MNDLENVTLKQLSRVVSVQPREHFVHKRFVESKYCKSAVQRSSIRYEKGAASTIQTEAVEPLHEASPRQIHKRDPRWIG